MIVEETFYRRDEIRRDTRHLPATTYNLAHRLLMRSGTCLFVPIRSMQILAVLDAEEVIFVDRDAGRLIDTAWQNFRPQVRSALDEPVPYDVVHYSTASTQNMQQLQGEFHKALLQLERRAPALAPARVLKLPLKDS